MLPPQRSHGDPPKGDLFLSLRDMGCYPIRSTRGGFTLVLPSDGPVDLAAGWDYAVCPRISSSTLLSSVLGEPNRASS